MWTEKNKRAIKFFTARPNGILRGGVGSQNRRRPLKPLEEHFRVLQKEQLSCSAFYKYTSVTQYLTSEQVIFKNTINRPKTIFPIYFFSFQICPAIIRYPVFVNADIGYAGYFCRYFGFKAKAVFFKVKLLDDILAEKFITSFHIRQVKIGKCIG